MDSQDMFADVDVADTQVSQQSKKRKRAECRVRQINVQWSTETVMSLIVEVQKLEPLYNVLHDPDSMHSSSFSFILLSK